MSAALGNQAHMFAQAHRRAAIRACLEIVAGDGAVRDVNLPAFDQSLLLVRFPDGGSLSIEFTSDAPDDEDPRLGAWLEIRSDDPSALMQRLVDAGIRRVSHPGHPYYFMAPGGQVFTIAGDGSGGPGSR